MVGQCLSLLLQIADNEAARGHHGSGKLRTEAFITLRLFVAKVGTADALAFFLPGVVSGFAKVLHVSKTMISGAAGSMESIDNAIRGLSEFLMIAFGDEENLYGLDMSVDDNTGSPPNKSKSTQEVLEALRHLPISAEDQVAISPGNLLCQPSTSSIHESELREKRTNSRHGMGPFCVKRTSDWIEETSLRVDKLLSATFPHLCIHPAKRVRHGLVDSIRGLLSKCMYTLKRSKLMLLECLCTLVCDDSEDTSFSAKEFLESLFMLDAKHLAEDEVAEIFSRLVEKLPRLVLGSDETIAVSHAQRLLAVVYYAGPQLVVDHLLRSPITATRFMDALALSLSHKSVFAGSVDKLILAKPNSAAYLHSIVELKSGGDNHRLVDSIPSDVSGISGFHDTGIQNHLEMVREYYELPRMPPWFVHVGSQKLYRALAGILRLVGLSTVADGRREVSLSVLTDFPLEYFRKLISELRMKEYSKESWHSWYARSGSGQTLRQASTAACILNEIIYGMSEQSVDLYAKMFQKSKTKADEIYGKESGCAAFYMNIYVLKFGIFQ
ncbi:hypothetical protein MRB53_024615 [Persea americana]|uniref:Uncharacterized protein n=1 Tax=Persea americana TaxID=3435 RepID=A0ACC2LDV4_PERAE|nr:hypothetical protein MRB53_024615 [Persea americana]